MWQLRIFHKDHFDESNYHLMKLVKETAEMPNIGYGDIIEINGETYCLCVTRLEDKMIFINNMPLIRNPVKMHGYSFRCPYCLTRNYSEVAQELPSDRDVIECECCFSKIEYERHANGPHTVTPVKMAPIVKL